jgi:hypothetical protein
VKPLLIAVVIAAAGAPDDAREGEDPIEPVEATGHRLPDPGDLHQQSLQRIQERELAKRPQQSKDLQRYQDLWAKRRIENYRYTVSGRGGWGIDTGTVRVTIRNGNAIAAEYVRLPLHIARANPAAQIVPAEIAASPPHDGVPGLFRMVEGVLSSPSTLVTVDYNAQYGFPVTIATDQLGVSDAASTTYIGGFEVLE